MHIKQVLSDKFTHKMVTLKRLKFAAQSEAFHPGQKSLLDKTIDTDLEALSQEIEHLAPSCAEEREKKQPKRTPLQAHLARRENRLEPASTTCDYGARIKRIGEDIAEKLDCQQGVFTVERHVCG
jgi:transposase